MSTVTTTSPAPGYRQRPLGTYVLAIAFILAPLLSLYGELWSVGLGHPRHFAAWGPWLREIWMVAWVVLGAVFVSGWSLLFVRSSSLHLTMLALGLVLAHNLTLWNRSPDSGAFRLVLMTVVTLTVMAVFWRAEFRRPYMEPRLRWWETAPRFRVDLPVRVGSVETRLLDISRTGALVEGGLEAEAGSRVRLAFKDFEVPAVVVRVAMNHATGLQFKDVTWSERRALKAYLRALEKDPTRVGAR